MQKSSKFTELWPKNQFFSHFEKSRHFENLCKELPIFFFKFKALIFIKYVAKNQNVCKLVNWYIMDDSTLWNFGSGY
jgi:hypothetical protein